MPQIAFIASSARSGDTATVTPGSPPDAPALPVAGFTIEDASGQAPFAIEITNTSTGTIDVYRWNFGDGTIVDTASATPPAHTYTAAGSYTVTLTVTNSTGSDSDSSGVTISAAPSAPAPAFTVSAASGASPLTVAFTNATTGTVTSYLWDFGDGSTSLETNPSHVFVNAGAFVVTMTATGPGGSAYTQTTITVSAPASTATRVALKVFNPSTAAVASGVVSRISVPFSRTEGPYTTSALSIETAAGQKVPCQFNVLSRWHGFPSDTSKRIMMLQCIFSADASAGGSSDYYLNLADAPTAGALSYTESASEFTINTGAASFLVAKSTVDLFSRVAIGSEVIVNASGAIDCALSSGQLFPADITTTVEVSGACMLRIRKTGRLGAAAGMRFTLRQTFYSGSAAVEVEFRLENSKVPWDSSPRDGVVGMLRVARCYLDVPIVNAGSLTVRDSTGDVTATNISGYKHLAWVRRQRHKKTDVTTKTYDGGVNYSFTTQHMLRVERQGVTTTGATYDGGWSVKGSAGGAIVGVDRYWQMGPRSVEVDATIGRVRIGQFPEGSHERPFAVRARNIQPWLSSTNPNYRPTGTNPDTGASWTDNDAAPLDFPDVTAPAGEAMPESPPVSGTDSPLGFWKWIPSASEWRLNAQPDKRVHVDDVNHYRVDGGAWHTIRFGLQFFGSATTPTTAQIAQFQSYINRTPIGLCAPSRYRESDIFLGQFTEKFAAQADPDADRAWRYFALLADNLAADPVASDSGQGFPSGAQQYRGWPLLMESGGIINDQGHQCSYGYHAFGDTFYGPDAWSNCHYDTGRAFAFGLLASSDIRFLDGFLDHGRWSRDQGRFHSGVLDYETSRISLTGLLNTNWKWSGCNRYEKGQWHGTDPTHPGSSHCWVGAETMLYWILGDPGAADSLRYAARYFCFPAHNASPAFFLGTGGERTLSWAIEGLVWINAALGPLAIGSLPNFSGVVSTTTAPLLDVAEFGLKNYRRWMMGMNPFSGASLPVYNRTNYVPAAHHKDFTSTDFSSQGFLLAPSANPKYNTQPWMSALFLQAAAMFFRTHPSKDFAVAAWAEYAQLLYLMADWIIDETMRANPGDAHNVQHHWYPPRVLRVMGKLGTAAGTFNPYAPSYTVNGDHSVGATSVAVTAVSGGTILAGDLVEFNSHKIASDATRNWPYRAASPLSGGVLSLSNPLVAALANGTGMIVNGGTNTTPNEVPNGSNSERASSATGQSLVGKFNTNLLLLWNAAMGLSQYALAVQGTAYESHAEGTALPIAKYAWRQCVRYAQHEEDWEYGLPADPGAEPPGPWVQASGVWTPGPSADLPKINIDRGVLYGGIAAKFLPREFGLDSMSTMAALRELGELP